MSSNPPPAQASRAAALPWHERLRPLVATTILLVSLLFVALGVYAALQSRAHYAERAELLTQNLAEATDAGVSANVDKIDLALEAVVRHLEGQLAQGGIDLKAADRFVRSESEHRSGLQAMRVLDARGVVIVGPRMDPRHPVSLADREWFMTQRDHADAGLVMSAPLRGRFAGEGWLVSFSRRYVGPDGRFAGAVTAAVPVAYFERLIRRIDVGPHGVVVLRDRQLALIARAPAASGPGTQVGDTQVSGDLRRLLAQGAERATYHAARTADGVERIDTMHRLRGAPIVVIVGVAPQDYLGPWYTEVATLAALCGAAIAVQAAGGLLLLRLGTQNRLARRRIELLAKVFEHSGEAIVITDRDNRIVEVNPAFTRQTGYRHDEVVGRDPHLLAAGRTTRAEYAAMWQAISRRGFWRGELWDRAKDGREYAKWMSVALVRGADGAVEYHIGSSIDMTELKDAEAKILALAHHDALTGLPNRAHLQARLEQASASARRDRLEMAMLFVDLDRFKNVNDTLGHDVGDALLIEVARRLRGAVRESDIVARLGGDEFIVVLTGVADGARSGAAMAVKLLAELSLPYAVAGHALHSTPSIGVAVFPGDGADAQALMKAADTAMYHAKSAGRNNYRFFTREMTEAAARGLALEAGLRSAVERGELALHYQPQADLRSGRVVAVEALLRWNHPGFGAVSPLEFIPIAEETGQIDAIGAWVLGEALAQVARWRAHEFPQLRVAVNVSTHQLRNHGFARQVAQALERQGLPGAALEIEVTESAAMHDPARTAALLGELRALGVALAIDDFGTGYSSLAYLKRLPLSSLKLDRSFVMDLEHDKNDAAICIATIQLAHSLGLTVIAEGVESRNQLEFLRDLECDMAQGYHIARPLPAHDCSEFLHKAAGGLSIAEAVTLQGLDAI